MRILGKADPSHASNFNGLTASHFATTWTWGLRHLIQVGANVDAKDHYGRRPLHLAVANGYVEAVHILLQKDCSLFTPTSTPSLLELSLDLDGPAQIPITDAITVALIDRHKRLLDRAFFTMSEREISRLNLSRDKIRERQIVSIQDSITSHGYELPDALALDGKGVYAAIVRKRSRKTTPEIAEKFWTAGFDDIQTPNEEGVSMILGSWFQADLDMVAWFISKGASPHTRHDDRSHCGLHLYAYSFGYDYDRFSVKPELASKHAELIRQVQSEKILYHDRCFCLCSPKGCTPIAFLFKTQWRFEKISVQHCFEAWVKNTKPDSELLERYFHDLTRILLFQLCGHGANHTCCIPLHEGVFYARFVPKTRRPKRKEFRLFNRMMRTFELFRQEYEGPILEIPFRFLEACQENKIDYLIQRMADKVHDNDSQDEDQEGSESEDEDEDEGRARKAQMPGSWPGIQKEIGRDEIRVQSIVLPLGPHFKPRPEG